MKLFADAIFQDSNNNKIFCTFSTAQQMPKTKELKSEQQIAVRCLRESGLSYHEIGKQVGCHHSTAMKIYKKFATTGSVENKERTGRPNRFNERGE